MKRFVLLLSVFKAIFLVASAKPVPNAQEALVSDLSCLVMPSVENLESCFGTKLSFTK